MRNRIVGRHKDVAGTVRRAECSVLGVLALLVMVTPAFAQAPAVRRVEFDEAVRVALERNPTAAIAGAAIAEANALVQQARAATRPLVQASVNNITLDSARGFSGGVTQPQNQTIVGGSASLPIVAATEWAAVNQARDRVDLANASAVASRRQIAVATARTFLEIINTRRQVDVDARALEAARAHFTYADRRLEGGVGSRLNQVRAAQAVASDEARLENTRLGLVRAQEALGVLLAEDGPVDAGAPPTLDLPASVDDASWMNDRPDLRVEAIAIRSAERVLRDSWKEWLPSATASFEPQYVAPSGLLQPSRTWRVVFSVSQPIFDSRPRAAQAIRRVALDRARFVRTVVEIQARSEVRIARASVESYERALASAERAAEHANNVLQITNTAFEVGATTNIEVIDAQRSARDADTAAALAEDAVRQARLDLLVALGRFPR